MSKSVKTIAEIDAEMRQLEELRKQAMEVRAKEIGELAIRLDLGGVDDAVLIGALRDVADKIKGTAPVVASWRAAGETFLGGKRGPKKRDKVAPASPPAAAGNQPAPAGESANAAQGQAGNLGDAG